MSNPKEIKKRIDELHSEIERALKLPGIMVITPIVLQKHAENVALTSQLAEISSQRLERRTDTLIRLTWAVVGFTAALLLRTFILMKRG
jgi:hypothetical protein